MSALDGCDYSFVRAKTPEDQTVTGQTTPDGGSALRRRVRVFVSLCSKMSDKGSS